MNDTEVEKAVQHLCTDKECVHCSLKKELDHLLNDSVQKTKMYSFCEVRELVKQAIKAEKERLLEDFPKPEGNLNASNWERYIERIDAWKSELINKSK